jgi:hypothetical protein
MVRPAFHGRASLSVTSSVHCLLHRVVTRTQRHKHTNTRFQIQGLRVRVPPGPLRGVWGL